MDPTPTLPALHVDPSNREAAAAWDGPSGAFWAENVDDFDHAVAAYLPALLAAAALAPGLQVLDVGCGNGVTTRAAARVTGSAVGVDLSSRMLDVARRRAVAERVAARFVHADAQIADLGKHTFDRVISRHGVMFFGDPAAAFANLARALRPGGRLALLVWGAIADNAWITGFRQVVLRGRPAPLPPPFAFGGPAEIRALLARTGFTDVEVADVREPMVFGPVETAERMATRLVGGLLAELPRHAQEQALEELRASIAAHDGPAGVAYPSACLLVTAQVPG